MLKKLLFLTWSITLFSQVYASVGNVSLLRGMADIDRQTIVMEAKVLMDIEEKDKVFTKEETKMQITFKDDTVITLGALTSFGVEEYLEDEKDSKATFSVTQGAFKVITGKVGKLAPKNFMVKTKSSSIGIRGTIFVGEVNLNNTDKDYISCLDGSIVVTSLKTNEEIMLHSGEMVIIYPDGVFEKLNLSFENFSLLSSSSTQSSSSQVSIQTTKSEEFQEESTQTTKREETQKAPTATTSTITSKSSDWSDDLRYNKKYDGLGDGTLIPTATQDMQTLIDNKTVQSYSGKGSGTFSQTGQQTAGTLKASGSINADVGLKIDFGSTAPTQLNINNQRVNFTSATLGTQVATQDELTNLSNSVNAQSTNSAITMDTTTISASDASLASQATVQSPSTTQNISINGNFKNANAGKFIGTMKQTTTATNLSSQINMNLDLSKQ